MIEKDIKELKEQLENCCKDFLEMTDAGPKAREMLPRIVNVAISIGNIQAAEEARKVINVFNPIRK